ncbi:unnamed protein product [Caenorhabditis auriculariae]|uniref:Uncharacterized protein n=1 Tax=Caenorhabditis auriculariae TaxID=2777116 RepID=A0A8S1HJL8_9PELO|nr:unnamed protein product [Caenorhabditis auriculariae]
MYGSELTRLLLRDGPSAKIFAGVFSSDKIPRLRRRRYALIVNTDRQGEPGRHWQVLYVDGKTCYFFCSLNEPPTEGVSKYLQRFDHVVCNTAREQRLNTETCGGFACFVVAMLARGHSFGHICSLFKRIKRDDAFIRYFMKNAFDYNLKG